MVVIYLLNNNDRVRRSQQSIVVEQRIRILFGKIPSRLRDIANAVSILFEWIQMVAH